MIGTRRVHSFVHVAIGTLLIVCTSRASVASAQVELPSELEVHAAPVGPRDGVALSLPTTLERHALHLQLRTDYLNRPLAVRLQGAPGDTVHVVEHRLRGQLAASFGVAERASLYVAFPFVLHQTGAGVLGLDRPAARGVGDLVIGLDAHLFGGLDGLQVGLGLALIEPTGKARAFASDGRIGGRAVARLAYAGQRFVVGGTLGVSLRPEREWLTYRSGADLLLVLGAQFFPVEGLRLGAEYTLATALVGARFGNTGRTPMEALIHARVTLTSAIYAQAGVGVGLGDGVGSPRVRATLSLGWITGTLF